MKGAFDSFKTKHADIIAKGGEEVKESASAQHSTTQPDTANSSAVKQAHQEGSLSARSNRSSSKPLNNSQIVKRRSLNLNATSNSAKEVQAETGSERSHYSNSSGAKKNLKVKSELDEKDEQIRQLLEQIEQLKNSQV